MDKFSYAIGLGIGQNLLSMGAKGIAVDDFAQAIKDVLEGNQTAISHTEARDIVNKYFAELEEKMNAANIEAGKKFLEENKKTRGSCYASQRTSIRSYHRRKRRSLCQSNRPGTMPLRRHTD